MAKNLPTESPGSQPKVIACVLIHETVLCYSVAESDRYAKLRVSKKALGELEGLAPYEFSDRFGCDCVSSMGEETAEVMGFASAVGN
jgi:endoribonuclease Dicer